MLTSNTWQQVGLCNGAAGTVYQLLYQTDHKPPDLPIAVLVNFDNYAGPPFLSHLPKCIPISPVVFAWESPNAKIHGVLTALSPMKKSRTCKYFDGEITDGKNNMRLLDSTLPKVYGESYNNLKGKTQLSRSPNAKSSAHAKV